AEAAALLADKHPLRFLAAKRENLRRHEVIVDDRVRCPQQPMRLQREQVRITGAGADEINGSSGCEAKLGSEDVRSRSRGGGGRLDARGIQPAGPRAEPLKPS